MKKMRNIVDIVLRLKFTLSPFGGSTPKKGFILWERGRENGSFPVEEGWETERFHRSKFYLRRGREDKL
jgi:hypothetical protein